VQLCGPLVYFPASNPPPFLPHLPGTHLSVSSEASFLNNRISIQSRRKPAAEKVRRRQSRATGMKPLSEEAGYRAKSTCGRPTTCAGRRYMALSPERWLWPNPPQVPAPMRALILRPEDGGGPHG
jgi:hypothetical protein